MYLFTCETTSRRIRDQDVEQLAGYELEKKPNASLAFQITEYFMA